MTLQRRIVLDANILIRGVLGQKVRLLLDRYADLTQFFTPQVCYQDAVKYLPLLLEKRNLSKDLGFEVLAELMGGITVVEASVYNIYEQDAKQRIAVRDIDDWPIVALALVLDCPIWTEDTDFFGVGVPTWTSDRVHLYLSQ